MENTLHIVFCKVRPEHYSHNVRVESCGYITMFNLNLRSKSKNLKMNVRNLTI